MATEKRLVDYKHLKCCVGNTSLHSELARKINQELTVISVEEIKQKIRDNSDNGTIPIQKAFEIIDSFMDNYADL